MKRFFLVTLLWATHQLFSGDTSQTSILHLGESAPQLAAQYLRASLAQIKDPETHETMEYNVATLSLLCDDIPGAIEILERLNSGALHNRSLEPKVAANLLYAYVKHLTTNLSIDEASKILSAADVLVSKHQCFAKVQVSLDSYRTDLVRRRVLNELSRCTTEHDVGRLHDIAWTMDRLSQPGVKVSYRPLIEEKIQMLESFHELSGKQKSPSQVGRFLNISGSSPVERAYLLFVENAVQAAKNTEAYDITALFKLRAWMQKDQGSFFSKETIKKVIDAFDHALGALLSVVSSQTRTPLVRSQYAYAQHCLDELSSGQTDSEHVANKIALIYTTPSKLLYKHLVEGSSDSELVNAIRWHIANTQQTTSPVESLWHTWYQINPDEAIGGFREWAIHQLRGTRPPNEALKTFLEMLSAHDILRTQSTTVTEQCRRMANRMLSTQHSRDEVTLFLELVMATTVDHLSVDCSESLKNTLKSIEVGLQTMDQLNHRIQNASLEDALTVLQLALSSMLAHDQLQAQRPTIWRYLGYAREELGQVSQSAFIKAQGWVKAALVALENPELSSQTQVPQGLQIDESPIVLHEDPLPLMKRLEREDRLLVNTVQREDL